MPALDLAAEFPAPDRQDWLDAVEKILRGKAFDTVLVSTTRDGLDVQPLYTAADVAPGPPVPVVADPDRVAHGWDVRQVHDATDPAACARDVVAELERGVTSVELTPPPGGFTLDTLRTATDGVLLDLAPVVLAPHADADAARALADLIAERGETATTRSWLGLDPLGEHARGGAVDAESVAEQVAVAAELIDRVPRGRTITIDTTRYGDAGASEAQEIGWALASGVAVLRAFEAAGVGPADAAATIGFRVSAGPDQFLTIAALRALRLGWSRVLEACAVPGDRRTALVQAVTSRAMFSTRDPWVNLLRGTTAALAAGVGGADAVTVLPFDDAIGAADPFSRRIARNTQLLLIEESHLARVIDPAAGSWFVESLTSRLLDAAWTRLQDTEATGGMVAALSSGAVADAIEATWQARLDQIGTRRAPLTGVSEFPDLGEAPVVRPPRPAPAGFPIRRPAAPFEELRDAADRATAATGRRPTIHLAALGDLATHTARSTWITNLVAVGGVGVDGGTADGSTSPLEAEARFADSGATVAVICSSDGVYAERAAATATALKEAGASLVALAGHPGDLRAELEAAGVDEFWHVGVDVLAVLRRLHTTLGVGD